MRFYQFKSEQHFKASLEGIGFEKESPKLLVIGRIPTGTESLQMVDVPAPDLGFDLKQVMAPDFLPVWYVLSVDAFEQWVAFEVLSQSASSAIA